jgi:hypothetical protein
LLSPIPFFGVILSPTKDLAAFKARFFGLVELVLRMTEKKKRLNKMFSLDVLADRR